MKLYRPVKKSLYHIHDNGIEPDVVVEYEELEVPKVALPEPYNKDNQIIAIIDDINTKLTSNDRQRISRTIRKDIVELMKGQEPELLLDWEVTVDPRRIIRLPGTVHGKTLRVCKVIHDLEGFIRNDDGDIVGYEPDDPIG